MDTAIKEFLASKFYKKEFEKQQKELDKCIKKEDQEGQIKAQQELNIVLQKASLELPEWLDNSSKRANQLSFTSHPPKFSHPDARIEAIIANCNQANDGLLRSGNVIVGLDVMGNAGSFDVDKFLHLVLNNNLTVLQNLEQDTKYIQEQFDSDNFDEIRGNFLKIRKTGASSKSSSRIKQIYFPVGDDYHLLSLLTPSAIVYKLKQRINDNFQPFSEKNKQIKDDIGKVIKNKSEFFGNLENVWGLSAIGYGGTKPQVISVLNYKNYGTAYLLPSMPPILERRKVQPPKKDFFTTNIWLNDYLKNDFKELYDILNNKHKEQKIKENRVRENKSYMSIRAIIDEFVVINIMYQFKRNIDQVREIKNGWSNSSIYNELPKWQKILLDNQYSNIRSDNEQNQNFLNETKLEFSIWFSKVYNKLFETNLGDIEITSIEKVIEDEMEVFK